MSFSDNFIKIMDAIGEKIGIAIDWTNKSVIPYMEQLCGRIVNYELYTSIAWIVFLIICIFIGIILVRKGIKDMYDSNRSVYDDLFILPMIIGSVMIFIACMILICQVGDVITCLTLPEKTIIEFIMKYK